MAVIKELYIKNFRGLNDVIIPIGKKITAIAGQNATGKSTILGMLGQPFNPPNETTTIFGDPFKAKFSNIFKLDISKEAPESHEYWVRFYNKSFCGDLEVKVKSRARKEAPGVRLVTRDEDRRSGKGNIPFPVIYLGMNRVYPIGSTTGVESIVQEYLKTDEETFYAKMHNRILIIEDNVSASYYSVKKQKDTLCANTEVYGERGNSAGQDNIGKIIGAIISFQRLKDSLGGKYQGGLLLIDELESTLYPGAQKRLIENLISWSRSLNIQIAFTTHSLEILSFLMNDNYNHNNDIKVVYLAKSRGKLQPIKDITFERIKHDLAMTINRNLPIPKINLYCEDEEAQLVIKNLLPRKYLKRISVIPGKLPGNTLIALAQSNIEEFRNSIIALDGDMYNKLNKNSSRENILLLPGTNSPEKMYRDYLFSLPAYDLFWAEAGAGYTRQHFLDKNPDITDRDVLKNWFKNEKKLWGKRSMSDLNNRWKKDNEDTLNKFIESFTNIFNYIAKQKGIPLIEE